MSSNSLDLWQDILLEWINGLHLESHHRVLFQDLADGEVFGRIIQDVLKFKVKSTSAEKNLIASFLQAEYPNIQLNLTTNKHDLLLGSLLIHYWSMRLDETQHQARQRVCTRLSGESEEAIRRFLQLLLPADSIYVTNVQLEQAINNLRPSSKKEVFPSTPARTPACNRGSLGKYLDSPVAKQQKLLAESQRAVRELTSELDQEQLEKAALEKDLVSQINKARKLEAQLKAAVDDVAKLEEEALKLQEDTSSRESLKQIKVYKEEIKSLNLYIDEMKSTIQPFEDKNIKLEARCAKLEATLKLSTNTSKEQELLITDLSQKIQTRDKELETLTSQNQDLQAFIKGMQNCHNDSSDFDMSMSFSHLPGSPMPVFDTLPLSNTIIDKQLKEKQVEVTQLENQIDTAAQKITEIFSKCNHGRPCGADILVDLETLENMFEQKKQDLEEVTRKNLLEVEELLLRCRSSDTQVAELINSIDEKNEEISALLEERNNLSEELITIQAQERCLAETCRGLNKELADSQSEVQSLTLCCKKTEKELSVVREKLSSQETELSDMLEKNDNLRQQLESARMEITEKESGISMLTEEKNALSLQLKIADEDRYEIHGKYEAQEVDYKKSQTEVVELLSRCHVLEAKVSERDHAIVKLNEAVSTLQHEHEAIGNELADLKDREVQLTGSLRDTQTELVKSLEHVNALESRCKENDKKIVQLEKSLVERSTEVSDVTGKHALLLQEFDDSKKLLAAKQNEIVKLTEECSGLSSRLDAVIEERSKFREDLHCQEAEALKSHAEVESLVLRCEDYDAKIADLNTNIEKKSEDIGNMVEQRNLLSSRLAESQETMNELTESLRKMEIGRVNAESALEIRCKENAEKTTELQSLIDERNAELEVLSGRHTLLCKEFEEAQQSLVEKQSQIDKLTIDCADLGTRMDAAVEERMKLIEDFHCKEAHLLKVQEELVVENEANVANLKGSINKKIEEIAEMEEQRNQLSSTLVEAGEAETKLKESLQDTETELANTRDELEVCCRENEKKAAELETTIVEKNLELSVLSGKHEILLQEFDDSQKLLVDKQNEIVKLTEECSGLSSRLDAVIEERNKFREDLHCQEAEALKSHAEVESLVLRCEDYDAKIADLNTNIEKKSEDIANVVEQRNLLSSRLAESQETVNELTESLRKMEIGRVNAESALEIRCKENAEKTTELQSLIDERNAELEVLSGRHTLLCKEFEEAQQSLVEKQSQIDKLTIDCADLGTRMDAAVEERIKLIEDFHCKEAHLLKVQEELVVENEANVANLKGSINKKIEEIAEMEEQRNQLSSTLVEAGEAETKLKESLQDTETKLANTRVELEVCCRENEKKTAELETTVVEKNLELSVLSGKHEILLQEFDDSQKLLAAKQNEIVKLTEECSGLSSRLDAVIEERNKFREDLHCQEAETLKSHAEVKSLVLRCEDYDAKIADLNTNIEKKSEDIANVVEQRNLLSSRLAESQETVNELTESLRKMETGLANAESALELRCKEKAEITTELQTLIDERNAELEVLSGRHTLLCKEFEEAQQSLVEKQSQVDKLTIDCADLGTRMDAAVEERMKLIEDFHCKEVHLQKVQEELAVENEANVANLKGSINKKIEEIAEMEEQRNQLSSTLVEAREAETKLKESLQQIESSLTAVEEEARDLRSCHAKSEEKLAVYVRKEAETIEQLNEITRQHGDQLHELEDINQQLADKKLEVSQLSDLVANYNEEKNELLAEKAALTAEVSKNASEMETLVSEKNSLKNEVKVSESFCNKFIVHLSKILSSDTEIESDSLNAFEGSFRQCGYLKAEVLISSIEEKCEKYRNAISEAKLSAERMDNSWSSDNMRLKEELCIIAEREKSALASNCALEERVKAVEENISGECKTLTSQVCELIKFIDSADNSALVNSSAMSNPQSPTVDGFQRVKSKLSQLRDSISLIANNKSSLFDECCHVKDQLKEKVEEWQSLMSQVDVLTKSCDELKVENVRLQIALSAAENSRDERQIENGNWIQKYVLVEEKVATLEQTLVVVNSCGNHLKIQAEALKLRNADLLAELGEKIQCCLDWEAVCFEISNFKQTVGKRMEHVVLCKNKLDDQLSDLRRTYDQLNSCDLVDAANFEIVERIKFEIDSTLSRLEEKLNGSSLEALDCVYSSLSYPYLLIQQQVRRMEGEDATNPKINRYSVDIPKQIERLEEVLETMLCEIKNIPMKMNELRDSCLNETEPPTDAVSFLDDSLEQNQTLSFQDKESEPRAAFQAKVSDLGDPSTVAIENVVENIVVAHARQFQTLVALRNKIYSSDKKTKLDCKEMLETLKSKEKLKEKINEQQVSAAQLKESYTALLQDCERALSDSHKLRELLTSQEKETLRKQKQAEQLESQTEQLEEQLKSCYTEAQVKQKVEKLGIEYEEKLERMKDKMRDLFRKETAKLDEIKVQACAETEKLCKSDFENQIKKYKVYMKEQALEIDDLKEKLHQEKMEASFFSKKVAKLEAQLDARNNMVHHDPLLMKRDSVMEHLQRHAEPRVVRSQTATSTTVTRDIDPMSGLYRRQSVSTQQSVTSLHSIPSESFAAEDEEGEVFNNTYLGDLKAGKVRLPPAITGGERLGELQYRNSLCPPHLKSSYPAETQFHDPHSFRDDDVKLGFVSDVDHSDTSSLSALLLPGERQRKRDRGKNQTSYQKPGPPTPIKNGGRRSLQGGELLSPRAALREVNDGARAKVSTPNRIRQLFSTKNKRDENSPMTPRGRRLSLFRKSARGRDDC